MHPWLQWFASTNSTAEPHKGVFSLHHFPSLPTVQSYWEYKRYISENSKEWWLALTWAIYVHGRQKITLILGMVTLFQKWSYLAILSVATPHLRVQTYSKILTNAAEGPHTLLHTGISMLRNYTAACGPYPKAQRQPWHIRMGLRNQRSAVNPFSQTEETKAQNKGICLFQCK